MRRYHPVVALPPGARWQVLDLTGGPDWAGDRTSPWTLGRYDEDRRGVYTTDLFSDGRTLHVGVDLGGPAGTPVYSFTDAQILHLGALPAPGDYGHAIVTEQVWVGPEGQEETIWALYGHLSAASLVGRWPGQRVARGEVLGWLGAEAENGGWPPHVHFQLSRQRPLTHDLPGVVRPSERQDALWRYPNPLFVLDSIDLD